MINHDDVVFDEVIALSLAKVASPSGLGPQPAVRQRILAHIGQFAAGPGFSIRRSDEANWEPHPVAGVRMRILASNRLSGFVTLLLDVAAGTRFPIHHHSGAEECYVISGSLHTCGSRLEAGDFLHADAHTDHAEMWTDDGCRVLLVVPLEDTPSGGAR